MSLDSIIEKARKQLTPTKAERERIEKTIKKILSAAAEVLKPRGLSYTLSGSMIRDTWLPKKKDFDLFILFPEDTPREKLEKDGLSIGKAITKKLKGKYTIAYAEHPYTKAFLLGYDVDIVPCYKLKSAEKIQSAVDRTPFHNEWIKKNLPLELSNEVRLLKQFAKGAGVYGSDTKVQGMSGYLCEILIINSGSFKKLITEIAGWKAGDVLIDIENYHMELPVSLRRKFRLQPLVVIDPVDRNRNVAAALSIENFEKLVKYARDFIKSPSLKFFSEERKVDIKALEKAISSRKTVILGIKFKAPDIVPDILFPQLRRASGRIETLLNENEFNVIRRDVFGSAYAPYSTTSDRRRSSAYCFLLFEVANSELPAIMRVEGPPCNIEDRAQEFTKKYKKTWAEKGRWYAETERRFRKPEELLKHFLSASRKKLQENGIPSYVAREISNKFQIVGEKQIVKMIKRDKGFALFLGEHLGMYRKF